MIKIDEFKIDGSAKFLLNNIKTALKEIKLITPDGAKSLASNKDEAGEILDENIIKMSKLQNKLFAQSNYALLIIFQAMDTAGKDGAIKHVMAGLNPQGTKVHSFKQPSVEELSHDYLWRANLHLPERGQIGIYNRSYYEELLVVKVHNLIEKQKLPAELIKENIWAKRHEQINNFEKYMYDNGTRIVKIFLHISKEEQKKRLLARIDNKDKNWKFSDADIKERAYWDNYQQCYEETINKTASKIAPWFVVPSDIKWFARVVISEIIVNALSDLKLEYPKLTEKQYKALDDCKKLLMNEEVDDKSKKLKGQS